MGHRYSNEVTPIVVDGVIYISTGANDVFAIDVSTGSQLWEHRSTRTKDIFNCCGSTNRGVAVGDGRVYMGQLDGSVVALDQRTGKPIWRTEIESWKRGYIITSAPLYIDGMVITGISGGEYGGRGRVVALDAKTGKERWHFFTIPGPGVPGHESWPSDNDAWKTGGAPVWQTPAFDPELGLLYFSTGNASPNYAGKERAGQNLYTASVVAIDAKTGKYRWHFQTVHHDLWDYDPGSPVVLFDEVVAGVSRKALAAPSKTGWVYILDRATGKPILPITERAVPQEPSQETWPTQPVPQGDAFVPQSISPAEAASLRTKDPSAAWKYVNGGKIFTPYSASQSVIAKPTTLGGANWPPPSYNPLTGFLYVCASDGIALFNSDTETPAYDPAAIRQGNQYLGGFFESPKGATLGGTFTAMNMRNNRVIWQRRFGDGDNCYSGSATTAGGLVFMGRNDGRIVAYGATDGKELWEYQMGGGGFNAPPITFEWKGTQYVLAYAGGNKTLRTSVGDLVTLFALDGRLGPAVSGRPSARLSPGSYGGRGR